MNECTHCCKNFNVLEVAFLGLRTSLVLVQINQFFLNYAVKGFFARIVVAVAFAAHAADLGIGLELLLVLV